MLPDQIRQIRRGLPEILHFPYYPDRESPWLLANLMERRSKVSSLREGVTGKLLSRPLVKPLVAASGGELRQRDVIAVAHAQEAVAFRDLSRAARAVLDDLYGDKWFGFTLTFASWGEDEPASWAQMSRDGGNLVVQLGFPADHSVLMGRYLDPDARSKFEEGYHPVRRTGAPTLAWARLDVEDGVALIEEVQSDWLRLVQSQVAYLDRDAGRSREARSTRAYERELKAAYGKVWSRAMLLSVLVVLRDYLGVRDVFMHRPEPGAILKEIEAVFPPVSLYKDLPRAFGFSPTDAAPPFLERIRRRDLRTLRQGGPIFWRLQL